MTLVSNATSALGRLAHSIGEGVAHAKQWLFDDHPLTFGDVLDLVNPLQHLPGISTVYRRLTGDVISPAMRLAGGALFGGPLGAGLEALGLALMPGKSKPPTPTAEPANVAVASLRSPAVRAAMRVHGAPSAVAGARPHPPGGEAVLAAYTRPGPVTPGTQVNEQA